MEEPLDPNLSFLQAGELNICVFPHLQEFLIIDLRDTTSRNQRLRVLSTEDVLSEEFYHNVEHGFTHLLRNAGKTFIELNMVPQRVDDLLREDALRAILHILDEHAGEDSSPQVSVFVCTGPALSLSHAQLTHAVEVILGNEGTPQMLADCVSILEKLTQAEQKAVKMEERAHIRDALRGDQQQYFTLWQSQN